MNNNMGNNITGIILLVLSIWASVFAISTINSVMKASEEQERLHNELFNLIQEEKQLYDCVIDGVQEACVALEGGEG